MENQEMHSNVFRNSGYDKQLDDSVNKRELLGIMGVSGVKDTGSTLHILVQNKFQKNRQKDIRKKCNEI
jgi:hypothetical protein